MKIAFIHNHLSFLPELSAYQTFFQARSIQTCIAAYGEEKDSGADVYWYMMGYFPKAFDKQKLIIHEYASASVPPYRKVKDFLKSRLNPRPHFRLYLNDYVRQQINIHDEIPFGYRDMGAGDLFFRNTDSQTKEYDFIYSGNLMANRKLDLLLTIFEKGDLKNNTLCMLGNDREGLAERFKHCPNISFHAAVSWDQVPSVISKARYALNYIPDNEPFNSQTSTKFLEYAAMKIPVISTNYYWISEFQERYGGHYFLLKDDLSNFNLDRIEAFSFEFPDLESWRWEERIKESGVLEFILQPRNRRYKS